MSSAHFKARASWRTPQRIGCVISLALLLSACGYKGPLYMPPPPPAPDSSLTTPPAAPGNTSLTTPPAPQQTSPAAQEPSLLPDDTAQ